MKLPRRASVSPRSRRSVRLFCTTTIPCNIVGVLADAKFSGAREPVKADRLCLRPEAGGATFIAPAPRPHPADLAVHRQEPGTNFAPIATVNRHFLDDSFDKLYQR